MQAAGDQGGAEREDVTFPSGAERCAAWFSAAARIGRLDDRPGAEAGYRSVRPPGAPFDNEVAARIVLRIGLYRSSKEARKLTCPALFLLCEGDSVAPSKVARRQVAAAPRGELRMLPSGHFEIYTGEPFERNVAEQLAFLAARVPTAGTPQTA